MLVVFENEGLINPRAITTLGINAKSTENPIGFFGTGLKYAIAVLLRINGEITITSGKRKYVFSKKSIKVKNKSFEVIQMNNTELGFTTELGKNWELWMVFRELYSNALDEKGEVYLSPTIPPSKKGTTIISVKGLLSEFYDKDKTILSKKNPAYWNKLGELYSAPSKYLYYRNIRVLELEEMAPITFNLTKEMQLTEDRTIKEFWDVSSAVRNIVSDCDDEVVIRKAMSMQWIAELNYGYNESYSEVFLDFISKNVHKNSSFLEIVKRYRKDHDLYDTLILNEKQREQYRQAVSFLKNKFGYNVEEYNVKFVTTLGEDILGAAENGEILIAARAFMMGDVILKGTLLEEYLHLAFRLSDNTRKMQNFLIDLLINN